MHKIPTRFNAMPWVVHDEDAKIRNINLQLDMYTVIRLAI